MKVNIYCSACAAVSPEIDGAASLDEKDLDEVRKIIENMGWQARNIPLNTPSLCPECKNRWNAA